MKLLINATISFKKRYFFLEGAGVKTISKQITAMKEKSSAVPDPSTIIFLQQNFYIVKSLVTGEKNK